jgi:hypothetical protein
MGTKKAWDVAAAFAPQVAEGDYNDNLDTIAATLSGDPDGTDDGLVLGDAESGIGESGLSFAIGRRARKKPHHAGTFTRPMSDFLGAEIPTFTFAFPFCGSRKTASTPVVAADMTPLVGVDAILNGAGLKGLTDAQPGWSYKFDNTVFPFSALIYFFGNRLELEDCRCSGLSILFEPGSIPIATATIVVGTIKDPSSKTQTAVTLPTLDYGPQADESAPLIETVNHIWNVERGFQSLTLNIAPAIEEQRDSNLSDGLYKEVSDRVTSINASIFVDAAGEGEVYEAAQAWADAIGDLDQLSFKVGTDTGDGDITKAFEILAPTPELETTAMQKFGSKGGNLVNLNLINSAGDEELEILFR